LDHYEGFRKLFDEPNIHFENVFHNGIMEEKGPESGALGPRKKINGRWHLTGLMETQADLSAFLADTSRWGTGNSAKKYASLLNTALQSQRVGDIRMLSAEAAGGDSYLPGYGPGQ